MSVDISNPPHMSVNFNSPLLTLAVTLPLWSFLPLWHFLPLWRFLPLWHFLPLWRFIPLWHFLPLWSFLPLYGLLLHRRFPLWWLLLLRSWSLWLPGLHDLPPLIFKVLPLLPLFLDTLQFLELLVNVVELFNPLPLMSR